MALSENPGNEVGVVTNKMADAEESRATVPSIICVAQNWILDYCMYQLWQEFIQGERLSENWQKTVIGSCLCAKKQKVVMPDELRVTIICFKLNVILTFRSAK